MTAKRWALVCFKKEGSPFYLSYDSAEWSREEVAKLAGSIKRSDLHFAVMTAQAAVDLGAHCADGEELE